MGNNPERPQGEQVPEDEPLSMNGFNKHLLNIAELKERRVQSLEERAEHCRETLEMRYSMPDSEYIVRLEEIVESEMSSLLYVAGVDKKAADDARKIVNENLSSSLE